MSNLRKTVYLSFFVLLSACQTTEEKLIIGKWNAYELLECEDIVPINTTIVNLEFKSNGTYIFNSTLNIHEEGKYYLNGGYLFTKDNIKPNATEKAVFIKSIAQDTLVLEMSFKGKEQFLTLVREGAVKQKTLDVDKKEDITEVSNEEQDSIPLITNDDIIVENGTPPPADYYGTEGVAAATNRLVSDIKATKKPTSTEPKSPEKRPEPTFKSKEKYTEEAKKLKERELAKEREAKKRQAQMKKKG